MFTLDVKKYCDNVQTFKTYIAELESMEKELNETYERMKANDSCLNEQTTFMGFGKTKYELKDSCKQKIQEINKNKAKLITLLDNIKTTLTEKQYAKTNQAKLDHLLEAIKAEMDTIVTEDVSIWDEAKKKINITKIVGIVKKFATVVLSVASGKYVEAANKAIAFIKNIMKDCQKE